MDDRPRYDYIKLRDALEQCHRAGEPLPEWVARDLFAILNLLGNERNGRHPSQWASYEQDLIDYMRFQAVNEARRRGITGDDAFAVAADVLDMFGGQWEAIREACKRVRRNLRENPNRYDRFEGISPIDGFRRRWDAAITEIVGGQKYKG